MQQWLGVTTPLVMQSMRRVVNPIFYVRISFAALGELQVQVAASEL
jgi:hypothetical protein